MGPLEISKAERDAIHKQHEDATKKFFDRKNELKKGVQSIKKEEPKKPEAKVFKKTDIKKEVTKQVTKNPAK